MNKLLGVLMMILLTMTVIIDRVDYVTVQDRNGIRQEIKITFEHGVMQVPRDRIKQDIIPLGTCKMEKNYEITGSSRVEYKFIPIRTRRHDGMLISE